jgi:hypothetical protein
MGRSIMPGISQIRHSSRLGDYFSCLRGVVGGRRSTLGRECVEFCNRKNNV